MPANLENSAVATGHRPQEKVNFHSKPKERQCQRVFKLPYNCTHSHATNLMLKILQARPQQYMYGELSDVPAGFREGRGTRNQIAIDKAREFQKNVYFCQSLTMWITANCGKFFKRWDYQTTLPAS